MWLGHLVAEAKAGYGGEIPSLDLREHGAVIWAGYY
jgi:hypothetical protein